MKDIKKHNKTSLLSKIKEAHTNREIYKINLHEGRVRCRVVNFADAIRGIRELLNFFNKKGE